jgi:hypothetical protein
LACRCGVGDGLQLAQGAGGAELVIRAGVASTPAGGRSKTWRRSTDVTGRPARPAPQPEQAAGSRQQAAGSRQQAAGSRQQAAGSRIVPHLPVRPGHLR